MPSAALIHSSCRRSGRRPSFFHLAVDLLHPLSRPVVGVDVVAVADVAAAHEDHGGAFHEPFPDEFLIDAAGAHDADQAGVGGVLEA